MPLYPLFADLAGREVLVVGGGEVALRKVEALLQAGARVRLHAHELHPVLAGWIDAGRIDRLRGDFDPAWIDAAWLMVVATDDGAFNATLAAQAGARRRFANVVDDAALSTFQVPAVIDRAPLQLAISSGGAAPMLARRLRERLEAELDPALGALAGLFARHRTAIRARLPELGHRRRWFDAVIDGPVPALLREGRDADAAQAFLAMLDDAGMVPAGGRASLVGTGPGDPGQLTLAALRAMALADVLLVDAAVAAPVLALARKDATRELAPGDPDACSGRVRDHAGAGRHVVWLRPGDGFREAPFDAIATALREAAWPCEVHAGVGDPAAWKRAGA
ncbi:precorrin-2 dehydrogenase/sirohydrochlorin ferrochelatase family protein [Luteimonas kalidii]|uniref:precorrin-2 dehydrogenase n=1 Tax=Luteimonas kalidii TaxID=3042025 RepID=A0ABT6JWE9_9GAMM|nr:bifunctional precorrin-2 dehydrogenase/sirohydrochlorin ferrochelatase [Luteimonas kalidii]MDH5835010.1 bifunctional precorrin-2 dehydrogenase/sirohydrochlorin ferrochelatase [Luteimonas kalidii]